MSQSSATNCDTRRCRARSLLSQCRRNVAATNKNVIFWGFHWIFVYFLIFKKMSQSLCDKAATIATFGLVLYNVAEFSV